MKYFKPVDSLVCRAGGKSANLRKDWQLVFSFGASPTFGLTLQDQTQKLATEFLAFRRTRLSNYTLHRIHGLGSDWTTAAQVLATLGKLLAVVVEHF